MSSIGAAPGAAVTISNARAEASRRNGARSRGPRTPEGKARSAQNALKHGLRAARHLVLPAEDPGAFAALEAALVEELAPEGALQALLARQIVAAAWRLARVERMEAEMLVFEGGGGDLGLAVIRDGNSARALPTLVRYRAAAHAELLRSLRTLEALQTKASKAEAAKTGAAPEAHERAARRPMPAARAAVATRPNEPGAVPESHTEAHKTAARSAKRAARAPAAARPNEPERAGSRLPCVRPDGAPARALHEAAAPWLPGPDARRTPNEPEPHGVRGLDHGRTTPRQTPGTGPVPARRPASAGAGTDSHGPMDPPNESLTDHG